MAFSPSSDHVVRGLAKLLEQFKDKAILSAVLGSYLRQIQKLEDATWEVVQSRHIDLAEGLALDFLGKVVGRPRLGLGDPDFRIAIRCQIRINRSSGRPEDLIDVTRLALPSGLGFTYTEFYPATVIIEVLDQVTFNIWVLYSALVRTKAGGVKLFLNYSPDPESETFAFSDSDSTMIDTSRGFGDADGSPEGGALIGVI
jgi:hypothetical protein